MGPSHALRGSGACYRKIRDIVQKLKTQLRDSSSLAKAQNGRDAAEPSVQVRLSCFAKGAPLNGVSVLGREAGTRRCKRGPRDREALGAALDLP